jgi:hypothetical protein
MQRAEDTSERQERAPRNQSLFREVNERIKNVNDGFHVFTSLNDWVCEWAIDGCVERIENDDSGVRACPTARRALLRRPRRQSRLAGGRASGRTTAELLDRREDRARREHRAEDGSSLRSAAVPHLKGNVKARLPHAKACPGDASRNPAWSRLCRHGFTWHPTPLRRVRAGGATRAPAAMSA